RGLSSPKWARQGMLLAAFGMAVAIVGTLFHEHIRWPWGYLIIAVGLGVGTVAGGAMGLRIPTAAGPPRAAPADPLRAPAATLVGVSEYVRGSEQLTGIHMTPLGFQVVIGGLTFTGSLMAAAKLQELLPGHPITYRGQNASNIALLAAMVACFLILIMVPS